jgi:hypothetical protein
MFHLCCNAESVITGGRISDFQINWGDLNICGLLQRREGPESLVHMTEQTSCDYQLKLSKALIVHKIKLLCFTQCCGMRQKS